MEEVQAEVNDIPRTSVEHFLLNTNDEEAQNNAIMGVIVDTTSDTYARITRRNRAGQGEELDWMIQGMADELKSLGHTRGAEGHIILNSDNQNANKQLDAAVWKLLGGRAISGNPAKG